VFAVLSLANLIPIWAFRYFPGQDTPNHLYATEVLRLLLGAPGTVVPPALGQAFVPLLSLKTNVTFFALMLGLGHLGASVALAHRLVLSAYAVTLPLAALYAARAAAPRSSPMALLFLPLTWNWFAMQGLYNYVLSLPPALIWLGIIARDGGRPMRGAALALAAAALAVYLSHLGTFVALVVVTGVRIAWPDDSTELPLTRRLSSAAPLALCLLPTFVLAGWSVIMGLSIPHPPAEPTVSALEGYNVLEAAGSFFVEFAVRYHPWELAILGPPLALLIGLPVGAAMAARRRRLGQRESGVGDPEARAPRWPLRAAALLVTLYFILPHIVLGSDASPRLRPIVVFCLFCYGGVVLAAAGRRRIAAIALVSGLASVAALSLSFARLNHDLDDFTSGIPAVREGARLYPMVFDPRDPSVLVKPFIHAWGYYGLARHVVTPFAFAWHESRFPYRYRRLPLHLPESDFPADAEDEPYALVEGRLCEAERRLSPSQSCAEIRRRAEERLATLGASYDYVLTWAAPEDFLAVLRRRGYRTLCVRGAMALLAPR
jgi:hypothetical protein